MKIKFKKSMLFIIGLLAIFIYTTKADALTFEKGSVSKNSNIVIVPLSFNIAEGENVSQIKIDCETTNLDVICEIKKKDSYQNVVFETWMKPVGSEFLPSGRNDAFEMVITNTSSEDQTVIVNLKSSEFTSSAGTIKIDQNYFSPVEVSVPAKLSSNPKASDIHFSQGKMVPAFNPDVTDYTVYNIQDTINSVNAVYECQAGKNKCDDSGWSGGKAVNGSFITLNQGENQVSIELISEDGNNRQTYRFKIIRGETTFNSSKLSNIDVGEYIISPAFSKEVLEYSFNVPNKINSVKDIIKFTTEDQLANSTIEGGEALEVGENLIKIIVDNINGDESTTYSIKVNRMSLEAIEVTNYKNNTVTFLNSEGVKNSLNEEEFKIQYPEEFEKIKNGTYKFDNNGNLVTEDNKITEKKEEPKNEKKNYKKLILIIGLVVVGLIIIIVSGILIFKKKPKDKIIESIEDSVSDETQEIDETGIEESIIAENKKSEFEDTQDIDEALSDLMSTKQYNLSDFTDENDETIK